VREKGDVMTTEVSLLDRAVQERNWEAVALCLLVALIEKYNTVPPEALDDLLMLLEPFDGEADKASQA
jgi:hypothetical protein